MFDGESAPELGQILDLLAEVTLMVGEVRSVDATGGDASQQRHAQLRMVLGDEAQDAHLVGAPGTATPQGQGEVSGHASGWRAAEWKHGGRCPPQPRRR